MLILMHIEPKNGEVKILDTSDSKVQSVNLYPVAKQVNTGKIRIYGIRKISAADSSCKVLQHWNIAISPTEAKQALASEYVRLYGMTKTEAYKAVGL